MRIYTPKFVSRAVNMDVKYYKTQLCGYKGWIQQFRDRMEVEIKHIQVIKDLESPIIVEGERPVGFVMYKAPAFYLIGYIDNDISTIYPNELSPWYNVEKRCILYSEAVPRSWRIHELHNAVLVRLNLFEKIPNGISDIGHWECTRQALKMCVQCLGGDQINQLREKELELMTAIMNRKLLASTCEKLGIMVDIKALRGHVHAQYKKKLNITNRKELEECGILNLVKEWMGVKW